MPRLISLIFIALLAQVGPVGAEIRFADMIQAIRLGGSERMLAFALSDPGLPREARAARDRILYGLGVLGAPGTITSRSVRSTPILTWDSNINGGYGSSGFTFAGLPFTIEDRYHAVGGVLIGGSGSGAMRVVLGHATGLALTTHIGVAWAPEHDMQKLTAGGSSCITHMISYSTWGYGCLDATWRRIELGESVRAGLRTGVNQMFTSGIGIHEITVELQQNRIDAAQDYDQRLGGLTMTSALSGGHALTSGVQLGERVDQVNVMRERFWIGTVFELRGRAASITFGGQRNRGGAFLGAELEKRIWTVGLSYQLSDKVGATIHGAMTESNVAFHQDSQLGVSVSWRLSPR